MKIPKRTVDVMTVSERQSEASEQLPAIYNQAVPSEKSAAQAKIESINNLLTEAYKKASMLDLSQDEIDDLTADFEDADFRRGAGGKNDLIYIEHHALRQRLNKVIGLGKWSMIIRKSWTEEFMAGKPPSPAVRVYVESVLIVRGCYVAEAIGDGNYFKNNASGNFGDAYESAKSSALRRVYKEFGIGLQAWSKEFSDGWTSRYPGFEKPVRNK